MNKSVRKQCIPKCIIVSLEKNPPKVDFFKPDYQNIPLRTRRRFEFTWFLSSKDLVRKIQSTQELPAKLLARMTTNSGLD